MRHFPPRIAPTGNTSWNGRRDRAAQARFRRQVLNGASWRCQYVEYGLRCAATTDLQAHHTQAGNDDPATGIALCRLHHRTVDPYAR